MIAYYVYLSNKKIQGSQVFSDMQKKDKRRTFYEKEGHFRNVMEDAC